MEKVSFESWVE